MPISQFIILVEWMSFECFLPLLSVSSLLFLLEWLVVLVTSESSGLVVCLHWHFGGVHDF